MTYLKLMYIDVYIYMRGMALLREGCYRQELREVSREEINWPTDVYVSRPARALPSLLTGHYEKR